MQNGTEEFKIHPEDFAKARKALVEAEIPKQYNLWVFKEKDGTKHNAYFTDEEIEERKRTNPDILWID